MIVGLYRATQAFVRFLFLLIFWPTVIGEEKMPKEGPIVLCANHQSMLDPVFIAIYSKRPIHFMAKKHLFSFAPFGALLRKVGVFPVDRGGADIRALKTALQILKEEKVLGLFPEGTRVDEIRLDNFKEGVAVIAQRGHANIMPVRIRSTYRPFSRVYVEFRDLIDTKELTAGLSKDEATQLVTKTIFESIYKEEVEIGDYHRG